MSQEPDTALADFASTRVHLLTSASIEFEARVQAGGKWADNAELCRSLDEEGHFEPVDRGAMPAGSGLKAALPAGAREFTSNVRSIQSTRASRSSFTRCDASRESSASSASASVQSLLTSIWSSAA
jgi:hypothetical protein